MINKNRLIHLTQNILRIESENPPGNEYKLAKYIRKELEAIGLRVREYTFAKRRPNIVAVLKGKNPKRTLLITPHIDTVPAGRGWKFAPYSAKIVGNRLYGRGATDCKGNLAVGIEALRSLQEDKIRLNSTIIFAATVDEEAGSMLGLEPLVKKNILKPTFALILDSDAFNIIVAQKGLIHFKVSITGKKAHGAYPDRGINAIEQAVEIIKRLKNHQFKYKKHLLLKPPTVNIGTIKGGDKVNMVADWCEFEVDLRFTPGLKAKDLIRDVRKIIAGVTKKYKMEFSHIQAPGEISKDNYLVKSLLRAAQKNRVKAKIKGSEGATVITFFLEKGIPAVATGFGTSNTAHATDEYVGINDLIRGAKFLADFIKDFDKHETN